MYFVYSLLCADGTIYTGITTDLDRRVGEHNSSKLGAKYTRSRRPVKLIYQKQFTTRSEALVEEAKIKKLKRSDKEKLTLTNLSLQKSLLTPPSIE